MDRDGDGGNDELTALAADFVGDSLAAQGVRATLSYGGRTVDFSTGEVKRERRTPPPDPETRDARLEGYIGPGDPDELWPPATFYGGINLGKRMVAMPFGESRDLGDLGGALLDRDRLLARLEIWQLRIAYLWGEDLGKVNGEPRLWKWQKATPLTTTLLGMCNPPRVVDAFLLVNARVASFGELSRWQVQGTLHEALGCLKVRDGRLTIEALSSFWQAHIMRRYGATWRPDLAQLAEMMRLAEREQLPLWSNDEEDEGVDEDE